MQHRGQRIQFLLKGKNMDNINIDQIDNLIHSQYGEIGELHLEDNYVSFEVYRGDYEEAPQEIGDGDIEMQLYEKFDDPFFAVAYRITRMSNAD